MKRVIKVGDRYLGLVDEQSDALVFDGDSAEALGDLRTAANALRMNHLIAHNRLDDDQFRTVKLTPRGSLRMARVDNPLSNENRLSLDADPGDCTSAPKTDDGFALDTRDDPPNVS